MSKLPSISGKECIKVLGKFGFYVKRQEGSHIVLRKNDPFGQLVVPNHKTLDRGTLRAIIRQADLSVEEIEGNNRLHFCHSVISISYSLYLS